MRIRWKARMSRCSSTGVSGRLRTMARSREAVPSASSWMACCAAVIGTVSRETIRSGRSVRTSSFRRRSTTGPIRSRRRSRFR